MQKEQTALPAILRARWFLSLFLWVPAASGANSGSLHNQYFHSNRTEIDGRAFAVNTVAQTSDGYLWFGTDDGLVRYDGLLATYWEPGHGEALPGERVTALCAGSSGSLWIGTSAGLSRLADGHLTNYTQREGLPPGPVLAVVEDAAGVLWAGIGAASRGGLVSIEHGILKSHTLALGRDVPVASLYEDHGRNLWIGTAKGLYRRRTGSTSILPVLEDPKLVLSMAETSAGQLILIDSEGTVSLQGQSKTALGAAIDKIPVPLNVHADHQGNLWIGTRGQGLFRISDSGLEHFDRRDGLSNDLVTVLFEDSEGGLWAGTGGGLDHFREPRVKRWSKTEGLSGNSITAVLADRESRVWLGTFGGGLDRLDPGGLISHVQLPLANTANIVGLYQDRSGKMWLATSQVLGFISHGSFVEVDEADGTRLGRTFAIAPDAGATLWAADAAAGLLKIRDGKAWPAAIPETAGRNVYALYGLSNGEMWIGYFEGGITVVRSDGTTANYDDRGGLARGPILDMFEDRAGTVWVATGGGLSRFRNGSWTSWTDAQGMPKGGVQSIVEDRQGTLWMTTQAGLLYLERAELDRAPDRTPSRLSFGVIGPTDGFHPRRTRTLFTPRITMSADGRLWISTDDGLVSVDPAHIRRNTRHLPVVISRVAVDGHGVEPSAGEVQFTGKTIELDYSALTFTDPEAVRFRYKLDGIDSQWADAKTSRKIVYANLPPGRYPFHVIAANADGNWNEIPTTLTLHRLPYLYQRPFFFPACALMIGLCAYAFHYFRLRQLRNSFRLVLRERTRLTREIHDTVLQGFVGVVYLLEAASRGFERSPEMSKNQLDTALDQASVSLREARRAITYMRLPILESNSLPDALSVMGNQFVKDTAIGFHFSIKGQCRDLGYQVEAHLYLISREAVANAVSHANPKRISLALLYSSTDVRLKVWDDGVGFDLRVAERDGHFGLEGMRDRAHEIDALLEISSQPSQGTTVLITVPRKNVNHLPVFSIPPRNSTIQTGGGQ